MTCEDQCFTWHPAEIAGYLQLSPRTHIVIHMDAEETKTGKKRTMRSPRSGAEVPTGAHPKNTGGKKGRSGRPPGTWAEFMRQLRADPKVQAAVKEAATDHTSPGFRSAVKLLADYDDAKPAEKRQIVGPVDVRVTIEREGRRTTAS